MKSKIRVKSRNKKLRAGGESACVVLLVIPPRAVPIKEKVGDHHLQELLLVKS